MAQDEQNKSEQATPYKLQEARKRGQVSKSNDVNAVASLTAFTVVFLALAGDMTDKLVGLVRRLLLSAGEIRLERGSTLPWLGELGLQLIYLLSPLLLALLVVGVLTNVLQTGPVLSGFPLKPDFTRLNPVTGLKRLFSLRVLFELAKNLLKLAALALLVYLGLETLLPYLPQLSNTPLAKLPQELQHLFGVTAYAVIGIFGAAALIDFIFSKREFAKKMRMSRRDLKDEHKRREGDPEIKSKRRRQQNELLKQTRALGKVKEADIIITNPTHFAVALQYRPRQMAAPAVIAKGSGLLAARIRRLANRYGVPCVRSPKLARALYRQCAIDAAIPETCYPEVAPLFRWLANLPGCKWKDL